jgi:branched-chain amino acid transport system permease protein
MNWLHIIFMCEIYIILTLSANLVSGYTGLLSFANAAFYGISAYLTALIMKNYGLNYFLVLPVAMLFNIAVSLIITYFSIKLKNLYFIIGTIAFQIIISGILYNWENLTGGSDGIPDIPKVEILGYTFNSTIDYTILGGIFMVLVIGFFLSFQKTPFIRLLECIRDHELETISLGKNINYYKFICISISAALMAMSGSLYAVYNNFIDAKSFTLDESILIVSMLLIGGTGNIIGPIFGACFFVLLPEIIRLFPIESSQGASIQMIIYGLIMILVVRFKPNGLFGKFRFQ